MILFSPPPQVGHFDMCSIDGNAYEIARSNNVTLNSFVIIFLLDYTCIIVNNICEHPLKCLLIEKMQN